MRNKKRKQILNLKKSKTILEKSKNNVGRQNKRLNQTRALSRCVQSSVSKTEKQPRKGEKVLSKPKLPRNQHASCQPFTHRSGARFAG
jgi:hypothetical protein